MTTALGDLFAALHRRGELLPLLRREAEREVLVAAAREVATVSVEELQAAADHVRRSRGLTAAADAERWLAEQHLTVTEWEDFLEEELLLAKLRAHVTRDAGPAEFTADPTAYDRIRYRTIAVPDADLAFELRAQLADGADFVRLAVDHSADPAGGRPVTVFRRDLGELAAALFAAPPGTVVGPTNTPRGCALFLVEDVRLGVLDDATRAVIRDRAFAAWEADRVRDVAIPVSVLDAIR